MAIYLKMAPVKGSSTTAGHEGEIELSSFQWGAGLGVGSPRGGERTTSEPSVSEITATKVTDTSSEDLFKALLMGDTLAKGEVFFTAATKGETVTYATLVIEKVIVSGFSMSSGGDVPSESLSLNFAKFDWSFVGRDLEGGGSPTHLIYDLAANKVG